MNKLKDKEYYLISITSSILIGILLVELLIYKGIL